jgi:hypothetical protein
MELGIVTHFVISDEFLTGWFIRKGPVFIRQLWIYSMWMVYDNLHY